tara:strand:+ start:38 stop:1189 length:1152 start_codon:yes stop_codon:yes gene_type:complete
MKKVTFTLLLLLPFIQGCGLSGAYIFFGDKAWNSYKEAIKNSQINEAQEFVKAAYGNYKDSLTYDEKRYPLVYLKLADTSYIIRQNPSESLGWIKRGLSQVPDNSNLMAGLGKYTLLSAKSKNDSEHDKLLNEAKEHYRAALISDPLDPSFNVGLMEVFFYEIEKNKFEAKESKSKYLITQVEELFENLIDTDSALIKEASGVLAFLKADYRSAIEKLSSVLKGPYVRTEESRSRYYLARSYVESKRYDDAVDIATDVLNSSEDDFLIRGERVIAYYLKGDTSAGALDLEWMEKKSPKYHEFFYRLGRLFYKQNLSKKAQFYLLKAFRLDGENGNYAFALGENYLLDGNTRSARKFFDRAASVAPAGSALEKRSQQRLTEIGG